MKDNLVRKARVISVVDGDTVEARIFLGDGFSYIRDIRLLGIDTPERGSEGYDEATNFTKQHCEGKIVQLEFEEEVSSEESEFKDGGFGRLLATVYVEDEDSQYSLNDLLLSSGHATVYEK